MWQRIPEVPIPPFHQIHQEELDPIGDLFLSEDAVEVSEVLVHPWLGQ